MPTPFLLPSNQKLEFICPACKGELTTSSIDYQCLSCGLNFPVIAGIPDFRIFPDPYLSFSEDRDRTKIILNKLNELSLKELLIYYWSYSDVTPPLLREKFVTNALNGEARGQRLFDLLTKNNTNIPTRLIDIGCGTGNFLAVAAKYIQQPIGIDIAMRWLHLSRQRFIDKGLEVPALVCCCAEHLPFKAESFDMAVMASTFEFLQDENLALKELSRVINVSGTVMINTVNRFSLAKNPYAHLWGVGFLPKAWQISYVRQRQNASFENISLHSYQQVKDLSYQAFNQVDIALADVNEQTLSRLPNQTRCLIYLYRFLKKIPIITILLKQIAPEWDIRLTSPKQLL
tara:strand:+ start:21996 stop:23030 length:1035 start_codon:yes stop_codon:yes gene_type:complete